MKSLFLILSFFPGLLNAPASRTMTWTVKESAVTIVGSSNVNKFNFSVNETNGRDTLVLLEGSKGQKLIFDKGVFRLPVKKFRNGNPMLVRDFKKMLNARNYPDILMNFRSLTALANEQCQRMPADAEVEITLSGKTITRQVRVQTVRNGDNVSLTGCERLKFSDFDLKPPKDVLGFIDVKDELDIDFRFVLRVIKED